MEAASRPNAAGGGPRAGADDGIGRRLRAERERHGLSLRKLAAKLEISPSALSQIETGRSRPSVSTLYAIVNQLGISLDDVFSDHAAPPPAPEPRNATAGLVERVITGGVGHFGDEIVQRGDSRKIIEMESGARWERLNPTGDRDVDFLEVTYDVGGASSPGQTFMRHSGREYGLVLSGRLKVTVGFDEHELAPGDSICFDSSQPHRLETVGDEPAKAIWFVIGRYGSDARAQEWSGGDGGR